MKPTRWLLIGSLFTCAAFPVACSSDFHSCYETRSCPAGGKPGSDGAGAAGESETTGGAGGVAGTSEAGAAGDAMGPGAEGGAAGAAIDICEGVDFQSDPKNCGTCRHDCLGGECELGQCQPVTVVPDDAYMYNFVVSGEYLFWSGCNPAYTVCSVSRRRTNGGDAVKVLADDEGGTLAQIAASATQLLWPAQEHVRVCGIPACVGGAKDLVSAPNASFAKVHFSATAETLFWAGNKSGLNAFELGSTEAISIGSATADTVDISSDSRYVYWVNQSSRVGSDYVADGTLYKARLSDMKPVVLASGLKGEYGGLAVSSDAVFLAGKYSVQGDGSISEAIYRIPLPNGIGAAALPQFTAEKGNWPIIDGQFLYWANYGLGLIQRCRVSGCDAVEIVANTQSPSNLTQDDTSFYWNSSPKGFSAIVRLAK